MTEGYGGHLAFPFRLGTDGRTVQTASPADHVRDELLQLILTNLGERLFLPEFGGGVRRLVFENSDEAAAGLARATLTQAVSRWLGHRLELENLTVTADQESIQVAISYRPTGAAVTKTLRFQRRLMK